ncbi:hypothetical protein FW781_17725 [Chryseobacterium panacisoli]|uniref:Bacteriophage Mx8 p63 C-terminal domain-containing protein n=1 Tax=Chryseobacterium panacisoli TaxID=1807141 RepID=A0A5D8ZLD0_9FLAO|nr:P63C domain-containing protein [Chryseobacterium panacisoli]TZF93534.1 hypothetical protein FW781_17725 [Chryseobacterium panacisoli]
MTAKKIIKAEYGSDKTPLQLGEIEIPCYVLEDGTRVFSGRGIQKALGSTSTSGSWLSKFVNDSAIKPYLNTGVLEQLNNPIAFQRPQAGGSQSSTYGYEVTILIDICDSILQAKKTGTDIPENIIENAELIIRSVAKVGIVALVDEVTGYQYKRENDELQKILAKYISAELLPWQKKFPDIYYKELFRLNGWDFTVNGIKKRPGVIGTWTKKLIYEQLPAGILEELEKNVPKSNVGNKTARLHQLLTEDIGNPHLTAQINQMVTLFQLSDNMQHMWGQFNKLKSRQQGQLELPYNFNEKGFTIEPKEVDGATDNLENYDNK